MRLWALISGMLALFRTVNDICINNDIASKQKHFVILTVQYVVGDLT